MNGEQLAADLLLLTAHFLILAGALLRQAMSRTLVKLISSAALRLTLVDPRLPQPPGTGVNTAGFNSTTTFCCSGVSMTTPRPSSGHQVAKIFFPTRKSDCVM